MLTVPNVITLVRLAMVPVFLWLLFGADDWLSAGLLLGALGATDWVDGYIARRYNQVSELGKMLDPIADRVLFIVCVGGIIIAGAAPLWFSVLVVAREVVVGAVTAILTLRGMKRIDVQWVGKAATLALMFAFPFFLGGYANVRGSDLWMVIGWGFGIPGLILSYYAAFTYIPIWRKAYAESKADSKAERTRESQSGAPR